MKSMSQQLNKVSLDLVKWETCSSVMYVLTRNMLCARNAEEGKDACQVMELVPCLERDCHRGLINISGIICSPLPPLDKFPNGTVTNYHKQG